MTTKTEIRKLSLVRNDSFEVTLDTDLDRIRIMRGGEFVPLVQVAKALNASMDLIRCTQATDEIKRPVIKHSPGCPVYFSESCNCGFLDAINVLSSLDAS